MDHQTAVNIVYALCRFFVLNGEESLEVMDMSSKIDVIDRALISKNHYAMYISKEMSYDGVTLNRDSIYTRMNEALDVMTEIVNIKFITVKQMCMILHQNEGESEVQTILKFFMEMKQDKKIALKIMNLVAQLLCTSIGTRKVTQTMFMNLSSMINMMARSNTNAHELKMILHSIKNQEPDCEYVDLILMCTYAFIETLEDVSSLTMNEFASVCVDQETFDRFVESRKPVARVVTVPVHSTSIVPAHSTSSIVQSHPETMTDTKYDAWGLPIGEFTVLHHYPSQTSWHIPNGVTVDVIRQIQSTSYPKTIQEPTPEIVRYCTDGRGGFGPTGSMVFM